jgi:lipoprotein-anchoring transpeptidase ErfK/SrfK
MKTATAFLFALLLSTAAHAQIHLDVTLGGKTLDVRDASNKLLGSYQISPGMKGHPTPQGSFAIKRIVWNPSWVPPKAGWAKGKKATAPTDPKNPMKVVKIFFKEPDLYIHGTGDEQKLGDPASHGCIRMSAADAYALAKLVQQNGGAPQNDAWYQSVIGGGKSVTVAIPKAIPVKIGA